MQWKAVRESMEVYRAKGGLVQLYVTFMNNHTSTTPREVEYAALYLTKASQHRLPSSTQSARLALVGKAGKVLPVDPTLGWLTDDNIKPNETHVSASSRKFEIKKFHGY